MVNFIIIINKIYHLVTVVNLLTINDILANLRYLFITEQIRKPNAFMQYQHFVI